MKKITPNNIIIQDLRTCGRVLSTTSTSFENLFITRPSGVVSNSSIGHRRTFVNSKICISCAACKQPNAIIKAPKRLDRALILQIEIYLDFFFCFYLFLFFLEFTLNFSLLGAFPVICKFEPIEVVFSNRLFKGGNNQ